MIRKIPVFLLILSFYPFCRGQNITQQPVNDTICLGEPEASFSVACFTTDVIFTWEFRSSSTGSWAPITLSMTDFNGIDNDTLWVTNTDSYEGYEFRCALKNRFTDLFLGYSDAVKVIFIQPPVTDFGINQLSVESDCYTLCPDIFTKFIDRSADNYLITDRLWDFGDGNNSVFQDPNHIFPVNTETQDYTVTLSTKNFYGCSSTFPVTVTVLPYRELLISGPEIICGNQYSFDRDFYYTVSNPDPLCRYEWDLPMEYIIDTVHAGFATIRIHWNKIESAVQLKLGVIERTTACGRDCQTGDGMLEILLKERQTPDPAYKIMRKAEDKNILIYLGADMALYRWGFTNKASLEERVDEDWNFNFYDFQKFDINLDPNNYEFWVETSESECGECWTRSYYR
jgi:hypothetical protein